MRLEQLSLSPLMAAPAVTDESSRSDRLGRAHVTLAAGCAFLMRTVEGRTASPAAVYARLQGNRLRELDRFLSILLDETAQAVHGPGHDASGYARLRNTPNKLRLVAGMQRRAGSATVSMEIRLRAIGRISACLNHCSGVVHAPGLHRDVLLAGGRAGEALAVSRTIGPVSDKLRLSPETLHAIALFYREIGDRLWVQAHESSAQS